MSSNSDRLYNVRSGASATASTPVALVAATVKTVVGVLGSAGTTVALRRVRISFASVTAADVPATVEVGIITALGTSTAFTPIQITGSPLASAATAGYNHTVEPTYNRIMETFYCPVNNGYLEYWYPLGEEPMSAISQGFAVRVTAPQNQNCFASLLYSE